MTRPADPGAVSPAGILRELGLAVRLNGDGDGVQGSARITRHMHVPGTGRPRLSILAWWADYLAGRLAMEVIAPRVPVTLDLDVHLFRPAPGTGTITGTGRTLKAGRSVFVAAVTFADEHGDPFAAATGSFMAVPDPSALLPAAPPPDGPGGAGLGMPFAERAGCELRAPGVAELRRSEDGLNASGTLAGGLTALAAEEAILSLAPPGTTLCSLALRYLAAVRTGPCVATARSRDGLAHADLRDAGGGDRLCVTAVARTFPPAGPGVLRSGG
ncbi:hotdog domain-containing protein [Actinocorallia longicatena]|uniref:Acyl-CoA thioesterase-like C-terminal domain-containing protein n=1 Tax=Actinocorallia longicatena TaxID=111803 RepID=A0ABP6QGV3_9ACTN